MTAAAASAERRRELADALAVVRGRIAGAANAADRDPASVTLLAVTKTFPAGDAAALLGLGVLDLAENRNQEAEAKVAQVAEFAPGVAAAARWHFVGTIQSRKARAVAAYAHAVHSLDRLELVSRLADGVKRVGRARLEVFAQVSLDGDPARGGVAPAELAALADAVAATAGLELRGVMAVAPLGAPPEAAFARLAEVSARLRNEHPQADAISAGMSSDLEAAIEHGATHVRVGSALLGRRSPVVG